MSMKLPDFAGRKSSQIGALMARIAALEERVSDSSLLVPIQTFEPEPFELIKAITVVIQPVDDEFSASFFDANVNAAGSNECEAVDNLKETLLSRFDYLDSQPAEVLGPALLKQLAALRAFVRRKEAS